MVRALMTGRLSLLWVCEGSPFSPFSPYRPSLLEGGALTRMRPLPSSETSQE